MKPNNTQNADKKARSPFESGALVQAIISDQTNPLRLYKIPYEALLVLKNEDSSEETYQHHLVTDKFLNLSGQEFLYLVHFFVSPDYVQFYPNESKRKNHPSLNLTHYPCIAYFMFDNSIWSSNVYKSIDDFLLDFKIVAK